MLPRGILLVVGGHVLLRGFLLGLGMSLIAIVIYLYLLFSSLPGKGIYDYHIFVDRPAVFAYGVAVGISLVSTVVLLAVRAGQIYFEHRMKISGAL